MGEMQKEKDISTEYADVCVGVAGYFIDDDVVL